jgi:Flp pilus assembly pilin Flp
MQAAWTRFRSDEAAQGLVEYVIIVALVAIGLIAAFVLLRNSVGNVVNGTATQLDGHPTP